MTEDPPLTILLVEDNAADARYIREILGDARELTRRGTPTGTNPLADRSHPGGTASPELLHEPRLSAGLELLEERSVDVILLDLNLPDSAGLDTLSTTLERADETPVVVLTGVRDRETGMEALTRGAEEYLVKDELTADLLIRSIYHAIERHAHERKLEQQRERLATLNQLNGVVRRITDAVIEQPTREEVERTVCMALADVDPYEFAWIGTVDPARDRLELRVEAGVEGYFEAADVSVDPDDPTGQGPTGRAVRTQEIQVTQDALEDPDYEAWRELAREFGFRSSAAIPIVHEKTLYGVLNVYASRPRAFAGEERAVIGQLGEIVGHTIAALERKQALMSDDVLELELRIPDAFAAYDVATATTDRIEIDRVVPVERDRYLVYGSADADDLGVLRELADAVDHWTRLEVEDDESGRVAFELQQSEPPVLAPVASHGGYVEAAYVEDGDYHLTIHLPHTADVRRFVETVQESHPDAEVRAQRQVTRSGEEAGRVASAVEQELTDRQRAVAETAYHKGYFEWPRESTGEEIAESLDIAPATFSQHIREVESRIFAALFDGDAG